VFDSAAPALNASLRANCTAVGRELTPVMVIDDCLADPASLVEFAALSKRNVEHQIETLHPVFKKESGSFYPGRRCPLPESFGSTLLQQLAPLLCNGFARGRDVQFEPLVANLSLADVKKEHLRPIQSLPHFDDVRSDQLALVLYLFNGDLGGTGFYRHISTGFERITRPRLAEYAPKLKAEAMAHREILGRYMGRENALFAPTNYVEPAFNRAVIYPSNCLHSGVLNNAVDYSLCANGGRLTANMLILCNEV